MILKLMLFLVVKPDIKEYPHESIFSISNTSCKEYKICTQLGVNKYNCPASNLFGQRAQNCLLNLICPDTAICAYVPAGLYADPNYLNNSRYYIECVKTVYGMKIRYGERGYDEIFMSNIIPPYGSCHGIIEITTDKHTTISNSTTNSTIINTTTEIIPNITVPNITVTESTIIDNITTTPTPFPTLIPILSANCEREGTFPVYYSDCKIYMVCQPSGTSFMQYAYSCSSASYFDPWKEPCISGYNCLEDACIDQSSGSLYADLNYVNKTRYFQCAIGGTGNVIPLYLQCGGGQIFNNEKKLCNVSTTLLATSDKENIGVMRWLSSKLKWLVGMQ